MCTCKKYVSKSIKIICAWVVCGTPFNSKGVHYFWKKQEKEKEHGWWLQTGKVVATSELGVHSVSAAIQRT